MNVTSLKIKRLSPTGLEFRPYKSYPVPIESPPSFWSNHRYSTNIGYHYKVELISSDSIIVKLESTCSKNKYSFVSDAITFDKYISMLKDALENDKNYISIDLNVHFNNEFIDCNSCIRENSSCISITSSKPEKVTLKIFFDESKLLEAVKSYKETATISTATQSVDSVPNNGTLSYRTTSTTSIKEKEKEKMAENNNNNMFGMMPTGTTNPLNFGGLNLNFGLVNDSRIAATMAGIAFQTDDGRRVVFDKEKYELTDYGNMELGNFPLYMIPSKTLPTGDLACLNGEYVFIIDGSKFPMVKYLDPKTGNITEKIIPETAIEKALGFRFFTKVVALIDPKKILGGDEVDLSMVIALSAMQSNGGATNPLIPLLFLQKLTGGEESSDFFSGLFGGDGEGSMFENIMKMQVFSSMMGGNNGMSNGGFDMNSLLALSFATGEGGLFGSKKKKKDSKAKSKSKKTDTGDVVTKESLDQFLDNLKSYVDDKISSTKSTDNPAPKPARKAIKKKATPKKNAPSEAAATDTDET